MLSYVILCMNVYTYIYIYIYIYIHIYIYSSNKDFSKGRLSYFFSIVILLSARIAGRRKPRYLTPAANNTDF